MLVNKENREKLNENYVLWTTYSVLRFTQLEALPVFYEARTGYKRHQVI